MTVKHNSKLAYIGINEDGTARTLRGRVYLAIKATPERTRNELSRTLNIPINSICGRVKELLDSKAIVELDSRPDWWSGRLAAPLKIKEEV